MTQENQLPLRGGRKGHAIPTARKKGDNDDDITPLPSVAMSGGLSSQILDGKPSPPVGSSLNSTPWESRPTGYQFGRRRVISRVNSPTELVLPKHEAVREQGLSRKLTTRSRRCFVRVASWAMLVVHFIMQTTSTRPIDEPNSHIAESISHSDRGYSGGPFGGASSVVVLQAADEAYAAKMKSKMDTNRQWANCMNYTYQLKTISKPLFGNVYTEKVKAIHDAVEETSEESGWVIFLDGDVSFKGDSCDALERMIPTESIDLQTCEFIALSSAHTINTGVALMRSTNSTKELMRSWLAEQQRPDTLLSSGAADQLSLQEAVLGKVLGATYSGKCKSMGDQHQRNLCFKEHMPEEYRSAQNVCLLPCNATVPLQCNDCRGECNSHDSKVEQYLEKHGFD